MLAALTLGLTLAAATDTEAARPTAASVAAPPGEREEGADEQGDDEQGDDEQGDDERGDDEPGDDEQGKEGDDDDAGKDGGRGDGGARARRPDGHDEHEDDDEDHAPRSRGLPSLEGDKRRRDDDDAIFVDGGIGCALGGALPAVGTTAGLGLFYGSMIGGSACGNVAGFVGGVSGALVAIPSVLLLGPCAATGATCGAVLGAATSDKDIGRAVQWSLPGLGVGLLGGGVATAGLLVSSATNPEMQPWAMPVGTTLVIVGTMLSAAGGPLSVAGATLMQADDPDSDGAAVRKMPKKALRDGGIEARARLRSGPQPDPQPDPQWPERASIDGAGDGGAVDVAMAW
jgi:hypothetical protein